MATGWPWLPWGRPDKISIRLIEIEREEASHTVYLSKSMFLNIILAVWNPPWWEYLYHGNWQILQSSDPSPGWILNLAQHSTDVNPTRFPHLFFFSLYCGSHAFFSKRNQMEWTTIYETLSVPLSTLSLSSSQMVSRPFSVSYCSQTSIPERGCLVQPTSKGLHH